MRAIVKKWGNSASVRIPAAMLAEAGLRLDQPVDIRSDRGTIIIQPIKDVEYDLDELIAGITPENVHDDVDFGEPVGKEAF